MGVHTRGLVCGAVTHVWVVHHHGTRMRHPSNQFWVHLQLLAHDRVQEGLHDSCVAHTRGVCGATCVAPASIPACCSEATLVAFFWQPLPHQDPEVRGQHVLRHVACLGVHAAHGRLMPKGAEPTMWCQGTCRLGPVVYLTQRKGQVRDAQHVAVGLHTSSSSGSHTERSSSRSWRRRGRQVQPIATRHAYQFHGRLHRCSQAAIHCQSAVALRGTRHIMTCVTNDMRDPAVLPDRGLDA